MAEAGGLDDVGHEVAFDADWTNTGICDKCGSTQLYPNELGELICLVCGLQSQDVRNQVTEQLTDPNERTAALRGHKRRFKKDGEADSRFFATDVVNAVDFVRGLQEVLEANVQILITKFRAPVELHDIVGRIWEAYLTRWSQSKVPMFHVVNNVFVYGCHPWYLSKVYDDGLTPAGCIPPSVALTIAICYGALRMLQCGYLPSDLCMWLRNGDLVYLSAFSKLSAPLQVTLSAAQSFFSPPQIPCANTLYRLAFALCNNVGIAWPRSNIGLMIHRYVSVSRLPATVIDVALRLQKLDTMDTSLQLAYAHIHQSRRTGKQVLQFDKLAKERRRLDMDSPAYVSALIMLAIRFHSGWQSWPIPAREVHGGGVLTADEAARFDCGKIEEFCKLFDQEVNALEDLLLKANEKIGTAEIMDEDLLSTVRPADPAASATQQSDPMLGFLLTGSLTSSQPTSLNTAASSPTVEVRMQRRSVIAKKTKHETNVIRSSDHYKSLLSASEDLKSLAALLSEPSNDTSTSNDVGASHIAAKAVPPTSLGSITIYPPLRDAKSTMAPRYPPVLSVYPIEYLRMLSYVTSVADVPIWDVFRYIDFLEHLILHYMPLTGVPGIDYSATALRRATRAKSKKTAALEEDVHTSSTHTRSGRKRGRRELLSEMASSL